MGARWQGEQASQEQRDVMNRELAAGKVDP